MIYSNFEDLPVRKQSRKFVTRVYKLTKTHYKKDYDPVRQFRRAAVSIELNISEGFERKTNKDFARFLSNAKGSAGECRAILFISHDLGYLPLELFKELMYEAKSISRQLSKFSRHLTNTANRSGS